MYVMCVWMCIYIYVFVYMFMCVYLYIDTHIYASVTSRESLRWKCFNLCPLAETSLLAQPQFTQFFFLFKKFFIDVQLIYKIVSFSGVRQSDSVWYIYILFFF